MTTTQKPLYKVLEEGEARFPEIVGLYEWSLNYDTQKGPFTLFLDVIGYSQEEYGLPLFDFRTSALGYLEMDYLADALKEYARIGQDADDFVRSILRAEIL